MPHDIIDNRTRELAPEISNFLSDSIRAHFAVGYFFLSGFEAVAACISHLDQLRLLIGNVTNRQTETMKQRQSRASFAARPCFGPS